jgi:hypothetical protein
MCLLRTKKQYRHQKLIKNSIIPAFVILIFITGSCNIKTKSYSKENDKIVKIKFDTTGIELSQVYYDSINNFTIRYPEEWILMENYQKFTLMGSGPVLIDEKTKMTRDGGFGLDIKSYDETFTNTSFYEGNLKSIRETVIDFKIIEEKTINLNGIKAKYVSHKCIYNETPVTSIQVYFFNDQKGYVLNGTATSEEFTKYRDLYISIALSFKLE